MNNNYILVKIKHAMDLKNKDMVDIFQFGGITISEEEVQKLLEGARENTSDEDFDEDEIKEISKCKNITLESFLNGFIIFKRGEKETKTGQQPDILSINGNKNINNIMLKKLKIALSLSSQDMLDIFEEVGSSLTKGELADIFRKEGHKHYKKCADKYAINFLEGLSKMRV
jgi:uncharacterized protein YehS (DUF1456 family)